MGDFQYTRCRLTNPVEYRSHYVQTRRAFSDIKPAGKVVFLQLAADARKRQGAEAAGSGSGSGRERKRKRQGATLHAVEAQAETRKRRPADHATRRHVTHPAQRDRSTPTDAATAQ